MSVILLSDFSHKTSALPDLMKTPLSPLAITITSETLRLSQSNSAARDSQRLLEAFGSMKSHARQRRGRIRIHLLPETCATCPSPIPDKQECLWVYKCSCPLTIIQDKSPRQHSLIINHEPRANERIRLFLRQTHLDQLAR